MRWDGQHALYRYDGPGFQYERMREIRVRSTHRFTCIDDGTSSYLYAGEYPRADEIIRQASDGLDGADPLTRVRALQSLGGLELRVLSDEAVDGQLLHVIQLNRRHGKQLDEAGRACTTVTMECLSNPNGSTTTVHGVSRTWTTFAWIKRSIRRCSRLSSPRVWRCGICRSSLATCDHAMISRLRYVGQEEGCGRDGLFRAAGGNKRRGRRLAS